MSIWITRTVVRSSTRSTARRVVSATAAKPPAMRSASAMVSPALSSKMAGRLTLPMTPTCWPIGPTWITSSACTSRSELRLPFSSKS